MKAKALLIAVIALFCLNVSTVKAHWEPTAYNKSAVWLLCEATNGNLIMADDIYPDLGGIYISQDGGGLWEKCDVGDYAYTAYLVKDESVYLGGVECNVAISHNNGETWSNVNFKELLPEATDNNPIYAMEYHKGRIYAAVLTLGIVYSDDDGITWSLTDLESLLHDDNPDNGGQWCYNLRSFKGKLYNVGAFGIWEYDDVDDLWSKVDDRSWAGSSCVVDDIFYVAYNASGMPDGIRYTTDFQSWEVMPIPDYLTTSIRCLEYHQGAFFIGHVQEAVFYTMDQGETWNEYRENFPAFSPFPGLDLYGVPMNLVFSGDKMYCGVFSVDEGVGGVFLSPVPDELITAVSETQDVLHPVMYPNPANEFISLQLSKVSENQSAIIITDVMGRVQYKTIIQNEGANEVIIPVKEWNSGIYLCTVITGESKTTGKFIVE